MTHVKFQTAHPAQQFFNRINNAGFATQHPAVNIVSNKDGLRIEIAAPGVAKEDFQVKVEKNVLTVSAQKETTPDENTKIHRLEFAFNRFERSFRLPENIDVESIKASYNNGILELALAYKPELKPVAKTIEVA